MKKYNPLSPPQILVVGFLISILVGTLLLSLPYVHEPNVELSVTEALFTATSAITVTGLNVIDPGTTFNRVGEVIIIILIQLGGLGFMSFAIWVFVLLGKKINLRHRLLMQENTGQIYLQGIVKLALHLLWITLALELFGGFLLATRWHYYMGWGEALFQGFFHAVSAFNNAGFSLFPTGLMNDVNDIFITIVITSLILLGGLGFTVIIDIFNKRFRFSMFSLHSKVTLSTNLVLISMGIPFFFLIEYGNPNSLGPLSFISKLNATYFQVITTRTAGFNTLDIGLLTQATLFMFIIYMFIGASSGSTGGGIKVTTMALIWVSLKSILQGKKDAVIFERRIPVDHVLRGMAIIILSLTVIIIATLILDITERGQPFLKILFEVVSAFGTVGLSMNFTPELSEIGRYVIMLVMFIGRLGPLTFGYALAKKVEKEYFKYPEEKMMIG